MKSCSEKSRHKFVYDQNFISFLESDSQLITCYCHKPFAGRPMIECSSCLTWIHLKCANLKRNNIPDTWHCRKCQWRAPTESHQQKEESKSPKKQRSTSKRKVQSSSVVATGEGSSSEEHQPVKRARKSS